MHQDRQNKLDWRLQKVADFSQPSPQKILFVVLDGLGGLPHPEMLACGPRDTNGEKTPKSELEWASIHGKLSNLNEFVRDPKTVTGRIYPVGKGFTPGSVAGHLGLFGYDPQYYFVKRGPAEAAALQGEIEPGDIIARFNFCRIDNSGRITNRRAGRISTERCTELAAKLHHQLEIREAAVRIIPTAEHRGVFTLRKNYRSDPPLSEYVCDTDPGAEGTEPIVCQPLSLTDKAAMRTAKLVRNACSQAREILRDERDANMIILRGFGTLPILPHFNDVYNVEAAAIAVYPVYRGIANLLGMAVLNGRDAPLRAGTSFGPEVEILKQNYDNYDFFYLHYKLPDEKGEDKDFHGKVEAIHQFDEHFPDIRRLGFDVIVVTGDHATPSFLGGHSHHSVPLAMFSSVMKGYDQTLEFTEPACMGGARGIIDGPELMAIVLGNAGKLRKFDG